MNSLTKDGDEIKMTICKAVIFTAGLGRLMFAISQRKAEWDGIMSIQNACHLARQNFKTALSRANQECPYKENAILLSILLYVLNARASSVYDVRESGKFLLVKSGILGIWIRNTAHGIRNPSNDWNPESKFTDRDWNPVTGNQNPRLSLIPLHGAMW